MKKIFSIFLVMFNGVLFAQLANMPDSINYQAVLRDASGNVLPPGTSGTLNFKIFSDLNSANADYEENHSFTTTAIGLVNLYIGGGAKVGSNTFANVNWASGSACYEVRLDGTLIGPKQVFAAVPYALYAKNSGGGSLPPGLINQTMHYDASAGWKATNSILNDGTRIGVGVNPNNRVKLNIVTTDPLDSSVVHVAKLNANTGDALFRGLISGSTNTSAINPFAPVIGADLRANNLGNGFAIGVSGMANTANGIGVGVSGMAYGPSTSTLIGIYSKVDTTGNPNTFAAVFETGKVLVGSDIYFPNASALPGAVYKIDAQKRGYWAAASAGNTSVTINQGGIVNVTPSGVPSTVFTISTSAPIFGTSGIGTIVPGVYPNYSLNIPTPSLSFNAGSGMLTFQQLPLITNINISPQLGLIGNILTSGTSTLLIPGLSYWAKPSSTVVALGSSSDFVGIGTNIPATKLEVIGNTKFSDVNSNVGFVSAIENNAGSGQSGGALRISNTNSRTLTHRALMIENFTTKVGGSGTSKIGLEIQSIGSYAPTTGQPNIGFISNVSGADVNYSGIFTGGQVGINTNAPRNTLSVFGSVAVKKVSVANSYNMAPDDYIVESNAGAAITIQLPLTTQVDEGTMLVIRSRTNFFINLMAQAGDQIQRLGSALTGASTTVTALDVIRLYRSGNIWVEM